jgi:hypothetical protein
VAEELDVPMMVCHWPGDSGVVHPDDGGTAGDSTSVPPGGGGSSGPGTCEPQGSYRMRTLIAWEPEHLSEVVRLVADLGSGAVQPMVPDPMAGPGFGGTSTGEAPGSPGDSTVTSPPGSAGPGFMGEYLVRDDGLWWSVDGTQHDGAAVQHGTDGGVEPAGQRAACARAGVEGDHDGAGQCRRRAAHHPAVDHAAHAGRLGAHAAHAAYAGPSGAGTVRAAARLKARRRGESRVG